MPPRGVKNPKRQRQYAHIKESSLTRGASEGRAEEIAARTVNKQRRKAGETKTKPRRATAGKTARKRSTGSPSRGTRSRGKSTASSSRGSSGRGRGASSSRGSASRNRR